MPTSTALSQLSTSKKSHQPEALIVPNTGHARMSTSSRSISPIYLTAVPRIAFATGASRVSSPTQKVAWGIVVHNYRSGIELYIHPFIF